MIIFTINAVFTPKCKMWVVKKIPINIDHATLWSNTVASLLLPLVLRYEGINIDQGTAIKIEIIES